MPAVELCVVAVIVASELLCQLVRRLNPLELHVELHVKPQRTMHPPPLMEGEALASRVLELGPVGAKFLGPVIMEVPHFASLRGKEREIVILRSDNGETWREHTIENSDELIGEVLNDCFDPEGLRERKLKF